MQGGKETGAPFFPRYSLKRSQLHHCSRTGFSIAIERVCSAFVEGIGSDPGNFPRILRVRRVQCPHSQIVLTLIPLLKTLFAPTRVLFDSYRCTEITILLRQWRKSCSLYDGSNQCASQRSTRYINLLVRSSDYPQLNFPRRYMDDPCSINPLPRFGTRYTPGSFTVS